MKADLLAWLRGKDEGNQRAMNAAGLQELESEKARRERARKAGEIGGRGRPKDDSLADGAVAKYKEQPKPRTPRTIEKAARSAGVSERKVRQAQEVKRAARWFSAGPALPIPNAPPLPLPVIPAGLRSR